MNKNIINNLFVLLSLYEPDEQGKLRFYMFYVRKLHCNEDVV